MSPETRRRRMNPMNRVYWYYDQMVNANSCEWIEVEGWIDIGLLRDAAAIVARRHPVLGARLATSLLRGYNWIEDAKEQPIDIRHERLPARSTAEVHDRLVANIWGERLPLRRGRPFRIHVTELDGLTVVQVITTHVFTDGHSANLVVRDLVRAYRSLHEGVPWEPERADLTDRRPTELFTKHLSATQRIRLVAKAIRAVAGELVGHAGRVGSGRKPRGPTDVIMVDLGPQVLDAVKGMSTAMGVSRHPFYVVAALRTVEAFNTRRGVRPSNRSLKIIDNFSLRRFAHEEVLDLYDLCAFPYSLTADGALDDTALVRAISAQIEHLRGGEILSEVYRQEFYRLLATTSPKILATRLVTKAIVKSNFFLSNIGPVPEEITDFGGARIRDYYSFSQLFPPGQIMFLISTKGASLRLVCLFDRANFVRDEVAEELVGGFSHQLLDLGRRCGIPLASTDRGTKAGLVTEPVSVKS